MKLSTREDIEAPIETVFAAVTDFAAIERQFASRGVEIVSDASAPPEGVGRRWIAKASWRGRGHTIEAELMALTDGRGYTIQSRSGGVVCETVVDLVALSQTRTRMLVSLDLKPKTLSARLLVQSLKLAKSRLSERLETRVFDFARRVEGRAV